MLSENESVSPPMNGCLESDIRCGLYEISIFAVLVVAYGISYMISLYSKTRSRHVIDKRSSQKTEKLNKKKEVMRVMEQEPKPDHLENWKKVPDDALSKHPEESVQSFQRESVTKKKKGKKKSSNLVPKSEAANPISSKEKWNKVPFNMKHHTDHLQETSSMKSSSVQRNVDIPLSRRIVPELEVDEQRNQGSVKIEPNMPEQNKEKWNTVSFIMKHHTNHLQATKSNKYSLVQRNVDVPLSLRIVNEFEEDEQRNQGYRNTELDMPERNKEIEVVRRLLESNFDSSYFADGSAGAEECREGKNERKKKRRSRSVTSTGTVTPRLPKLTPTKSGSNYKVVIDHNGGILKLTDATLKFPPGCTRKKVELYIALCRKQNVRRGDKHTIFVTHALHLWRNILFETDDFTFCVPIRVNLNMVKCASDIPGIATVQRTDSIKDILWGFYEKGRCGENYVSFNINNLGGYRAISLKNEAMIYLHYQICVTRCHETDDPDQYILIVKFYTEDMENSVLDEARALPGLEVLKSESVYVQTRSILQLLLWRNGILEETTEFKVPKYESKIKKTTPIPLRRPPANIETPDPQPLLLEMSSQFSDTAQSNFHLKWKKAMITPDIVVNVNGQNAIGFLNNCN